LPAKLIYFLYRLLQFVALPLIVLYAILRGARDRRYFRRLGERFGFLPHTYQRTVPGAIWLHAVSLGEVLSAAGLVRRIRSAVPGAPLFLSTTTLAGRAAADERLAPLVDGIFYLPFDYVFCIRRVLRAIRPSLLVVMETEIWPNLFREAKRSGARVLLVNARISDRTAGRYRANRWFFEAVLSHADAILVQSEQDRLRFLEAGAREASVGPGGNLKYDFEPSQARVPEGLERLVARAGPEEIWIAASTTQPVEAGDPDEDDIVLEAFRKLAKTHPGLLLIVAPRKPERFDVVARKLEGLSHLRRSGLGEDSALALPGVLLVDSIGELGSLFRIATVVFMGGTLPRRGGHNILEPALFGCPVVAGPHMENFAEIAAEFTSAGAVVRIQDAAELASSVDSLLRDPVRRSQIGARALALAESRRGAAGRALEEIRALHAEAVPASVHWAPLGLLCRVLARLWVSGALRRQRRDRARRRALSTPVISVGGISMGGAGKTPFVLWLAERLKDRGIQPAILTRGYRRRSPEEVTVIPPGASASTELTGDEAQLLVRAAIAPVGIAAERYDAGLAVEREFHPSVFVLDDGFQHQRLARDLDIVLVDSLDPFAGGGVFPLGRLREPPEALRRAGLLVLTRTEEGRGYSGIEGRLREYNPHAPIFHARVKPLGWHSAEAAWGPRDLPFSKVVAFCGLANPATFWRTLETLGCRPLLSYAFGDHHTYRPAQLLRLASRARDAGAEALLTTQKDSMNLPADAAQLVGPLALGWLRIGVEVVEEEELLRFSISSSRAFKSRPPV
jgi:tetraacyldisaccharide 4'-kinase